MVKCSLCDSTTGIEKLYGYNICGLCKSKIRLFSKDSVKRFKTNYKKKPGRPTIEDDIKYRLDYIEKDFIKKKIKLMDMLDKLK
jgi:hypothetical protein